MSLVHFQMLEDPDFYSLVLFLQLNVFEMNLLPLILGEVYVLEDKDEGVAFLGSYVMALPVDELVVVVDHSAFPFLEQADILDAEGHAENLELENHTVLLEVVEHAA